MTEKVSSSSPPFAPEYIAETEFKTGNFSFVDRKLDMTTLEQIGELSSLTIDQKTDWAEGCCRSMGCCCVDFENVYNLYDSKDLGVPLISIKEDSGCCGRALCNPNHTLKMEWFNGKDSKNSLLDIEKPFKCCCPAFGPCCQKEITVKRKVPEEEVIGYVQQPFCGGCFTPTLNVYDKPGGSSLGKVTGPCCCIGGMFGSDWRFFDKSGQEHLKVHRDGCCANGCCRTMGTTADKYEIGFEDKSLPLDEKLTLISSVILVDYLFFEGDTNCSVIWCAFPPQFWCTCWDWYCCGATIPCKCKFCYDEAASTAKYGAAL
jgi:hypothetical protein